MFLYPDPPPLFPLSIHQGFVSHVKPVWHSLTATTVSGREFRVAKQAYPLWEFEIPFELLRDQTQNITVDVNWLNRRELEQLCGLFLLVRGQYGRFLYEYPRDRSRSSGYVGTGDAVTRTFTVGREMGTLGYSEPVGWLNQVLSVYVNGGELGSGAYSFSQNQLTLAVAPPGGAVVTADFTFYYLCRFIEDVADFEQFMRNLWTLQSCKFRSVKP